MAGDSKEFEFHEERRQVERTFRGNAPTGERVKDDTGPNAEPGMDVGASELPTRGDLGFPGSPNETPEDAGKGPRDIGSEPPDAISGDSPR